MIQVTLPTHIPHICQPEGEFFLDHPRAAPAPARLSGAEMAFSGGNRHKSVLRSRPDPSSVQPDTISSAAEAHPPSCDALARPKSSGVQEGQGWGLMLWHGCARSKEESATNFNCARPPSVCTPNRTYTFEAAHHWKPGLNGEQTCTHTNQYINPLSCITYAHGLV